MSIRPFIDETGIVRFPYKSITLEPNPRMVELDADVDY